MPRRGEGNGAQSVSTLELFFDLVFVFTITQLTSVLSHEPTWKGLLQSGLMLGLIFWMYGGYAWLTNAVVPDRIERRLVLLGGMAGFLVMALAVPGAFEGSGATFGIAYVCVVAIHLTMFARAGGVGVRTAIVNLAPANLGTALLVLIGGVLGGDAQYVLWALAFLGEWGSPLWIASREFAPEASHFVERHGLVLIVAIGESVVAVGFGAAELPVNLELVLASILALALSAGLWWSYFGSDEDGPERAIAAAKPAERFDLAIRAFGHAFMPLLLGVIAIAAGTKAGIGHPFDELDQAKAIMLGGGAALFLGSEAAFRRVLGLGFVDARLTAALAAAATIPLGTEVAAIAQIGALVAIFAAMLTVHERSLARA